MKEIATLVILVAALISPCSGAKELRPNVILILSDDSGFSDIGCYGGEIQTPNLDRLAAHGLRFSRMYSTAKCYPSRACLFTGYYFEQTGGFKTDGYASWVQTVPQRLNAAGYRSYHTGKWHQDATPAEVGFLRVSIPSAPAGSYIPTDGDLSNGAFKGSERIAQKGIDFIHDHVANHSDKPFFLNLAFNAPHFPLWALEKDIEKYRGAYDAGWDVIRERRLKRLKDLGIVSRDLSLPPMDRVENRPAGFATWEEVMDRFGPSEVIDTPPWNTLTKKQKRFQAMKMEIHAAMMDRMDQEIGRVVDVLKRTGAFDNTLIIYLSDNGASSEFMIRRNGHDPEARPGSNLTHYCIGPAWATASNTPFRYYKSYAHEGGIATPGIFHWPKGIAARGELRHSPAHFIDVAATILGLAGLPPGIEGAPPTPARDLTPTRRSWPRRWPNAPPTPARDLTPVLAEDGTVPLEYLFFRFKGKALIEGDFKIVSARVSSNDWQLYDLSKDRSELNDLSRAMPEKRKAMIARWEKLSKRFKHDLKAKP